MSLLGVAGMVCVVDLISFVTLVWAARFRTQAAQGGGHLQKISSSLVSRFGHGRFEGPCIKIQGREDMLQGHEDMLLGRF